LYAASPADWAKPAAPAKETTTVSKAMDRIEFFILRLLKLFYGQYSMG
jgi:hypothetical protein